MGERRVEAWVAHMLDCRRCRAYNIALGRYEPACRAQLCSAGVVLLDLWLDEGMAQRVERQQGRPNLSHTEAPVKFGPR